MIKFEGVLIRKKYVGYVFVGKTFDGYQLNIRFMNDNKDKDGLHIKYTTEKEAYEKLNELEKLLID